MARRISGVGRVTVSLRRSTRDDTPGDVTGGPSSVVRQEVLDGLADRTHDDIGSEGVLLPPAAPVKPRRTHAEVVGPFDVDAGSVADHPGTPERLGRQAGLRARRFEDAPVGLGEPELAGHTDRVEPGGEARVVYLQPL